MMFERGRSKRHKVAEDTHSEAAGYTDPPLSRLPCQPTLCQYRHAQLPVPKQRKGKKKAGKEESGGVGWGGVGWRGWGEGGF